MLEMLSSCWGKLHRDGGGLVVAEQSLADHCRDVATVFLALARLPGIRQRLARLAKLDRISDAMLARLCWLVYLHDLGKVNTGFRARRDVAAPPIGHIKPLAIALGDACDSGLYERVSGALQLQKLDAWGNGVEELFDAILSHHGRQWPKGEASQADVRYWRPTSAYDPVEALRLLRGQADGLFPVAFAVNQPPLPEATAFVHAIAGLTQLADWIASSGWERRGNSHAVSWVAPKLVEIGLDPTPWRGAITAQPVDFQTAFQVPPRPMQVEAADCEGRLAILEAETGSGKTEAALWRFVQLFRRGEVDGLFFALPTRTAAVQIFHRIDAMAGRLWPDAKPPVVLAVPGYLSPGTESGDAGSLPDAADPLDTAEADARTAPLWASEHPKRYFAATISVGTIDQALLSVLKVKHAHLRGAALMRHLIVVDEVHASDAYMRAVLERLLAHHLSAGGHTLLLSATLGAEARARLLVHAQGQRAIDCPPISMDAAIATHYPLITTLRARGAVEAPATSAATRRRIAIRTAELLDDATAIALQALAAARAGAKVLVVRNTVAGAVAVQRALEQQAGPDAPELFRVGPRSVASLHHGRFARSDRRLLDMAVEAALGKARPAGGRVVIGTQTLEQSLDLDADLLITDLCPIDVLLQRLGRLHRHAQEPDGAPRVRPADYATPFAVVLVPVGGLGPFRRSRPRGLSRHGLGYRLDTGTGAVIGAYPDLVILEATRQLIAAEPIWHIPAMNRKLIERALHSQALERLIANQPAAEQEEWRNHWNTVLGAGFADGTTAATNVLRHDLPFIHPKNTIAPDERVLTRLGADDLLVQLAAKGTPQPTGPFGCGSDCLAIPGWMVSGFDIDSLGVEPTPDGLCLTDASGRSFIYDHYGLRRS